MIGSGGIGAQSWVAGKLAEEVLDWLAQNKATVQQRREAGKAAATRSVSARRPAASGLSSARLLTNPSRCLDCHPS